MTSDKISHTPEYTKLFQAIVREWNVPPRGAIRSEANRERKRLLPQVHFETLRRLKVQT